MPKRVRDVPGCHGCPLFEDGNKNFVPDELKEGAKVFIVGQGPGAEEVEQARPFVGKTGQMMINKYLKDAGLTREDVSIGNAIRCRWRGTNELPKVNERMVRDALNHCSHAHFRVPPGTLCWYATLFLTVFTLTFGFLLVSLYSSHKATTPPCSSQEGR